MSTGKEETIARLKEQIDEEIVEDDPLLEEEDLGATPSVEMFISAGEELDLKSEIEEQEAVEVVEETEEETVEGRSSYREYVVLVQNVKEKNWAELARNMATNPESAVRMLGEDRIEEGRVYVAVPLRNWNPLPPAAVTKTTTISFG